MSALVVGAVTSDLKQTWRLARTLSDLARDVFHACIFKVGTGTAPPHPCYELGVDMLQCSRICCKAVQSVLGFGLKLTLKRGRDQEHSCTARIERLCSSEAASPDCGSKEFFEVQAFFSSGYRFPCVHSLQTHI